MATAADPMAATARFLAPFGPKSALEILMPCKEVTETPALTTSRPHLHPQAATALLLVATTTTKARVTKEATSSLLRADTTHRLRLTSTTRAATTKHLPKVTPAQPARATVRLLQDLVMVLLLQDNGTPLLPATAAPAMALLRAMVRVPVALLGSTLRTSRVLPPAKDHLDGISTPDRVLATRFNGGL